MTGTTQTNNRHKRRELQVEKLDDRALVEWRDMEGSELALTVVTARQLFCPKATDSEVLAFLNQAAHMRANPYLKEIHLVKYADNAPAQPVVGIGYILSRASRDPRYEGKRAGLLNRQGVEVPVVGTAAADVGGAWCEVYVRGFKYPVRVEVDIDEYDKHQALWKTYRKSMILKVAKAQAHREAFPGQFPAYIPEEVGDGTQSSEDLEPIVEAEGREIHEAEQEAAAEETQEAAEPEPEAPPAETPEQAPAQEPPGEPDQAALHDELRAKMKAAFAGDNHAGQRWLKHHYGSGISRIGQLRASQAADALAGLESLKDGALKGWTRGPGKGEKAASNGPETNGKLFDEAEK